MVPGLSKTDIDGYVNPVKPHAKALIKNQLEEIPSTKIIFALWKRWKKHVNLAITLDIEHGKDAKDLERPEDVYTKVYMPFNSFMTILTYQD